MRGLVAPSFLFFFFFASTAVVQAKTQFRDLHIANAIVNPDGHPRSAVVVNGITPGPIISGFKGDDFLVTVHNHLSDPHLRLSTTIHWHGIASPLPMKLQPRTAYDDGAAFVTQCPIAPGHSYTYHVETGNQAGTFWYHSHLSSQYIDGLRGPLVLYDPNDPHGHLYDVDDESTIIRLNDWYHNPAKELGDAWLNGTAPEPVPDSNLFNGVGRFAGGPKVERPIMVVQRGKRYRFRIINMSAIVPFNFAIQGHNLTVIEADGISHQPITVSSVSIFAGQRYSVVVNTNQSADNYWIAYPSNFRDATVPSVNQNYNGTEAFAVLHYEGAPETEPTSPQFVPDNSNALREHDLVPLVSPSLPDQADMVIPLRFHPKNPGEVDTPGVSNNWTVNGSQYTPPKIPTLLRILYLGATNKSDFPTSENTYAGVLPYNATVDVQLIGDFHHPFHLHGHTFQVIQSATGPRNTRNPPIRDTVVTNNNESDPAKAVTIRFRTNNPGPWFLHCHKHWHLEAGLAVVFAEDPEDQRYGPKALQPPKEWSDLCSIYNSAVLAAGDVDPGRGQRRLGMIF